MHEGATYTPIEAYLLFPNSTSTYLNANNISSISDKYRGLLSVM